MLEAPLGVIPSEFCNVDLSHKTRMLAQSDTGRTDRQTDKQTNR